MQSGNSATGIQASIATKQNRKSEIGAMVLFSPSLLLPPEQLILHTVHNLEKKENKLFYKTYLFL